jgi:hypothetical protein
MRERNSSRRFTSRGPGTQLDGVARLQAARVQHRQVGAAVAALVHQAAGLRKAHHRIELEAGVARLADHQGAARQAQLVADPQLAFVEPST